MSGIFYVNATGSKLVDDLLGPRGWAGDSVTFGFAAGRGDYESTYGFGEPGKGFAPLSQLQKAAAIDAARLWDELIALDIVHSGTAGGADIRIGVSSAPSTAWAYWPGQSGEAGDIWLGSSRGYYTNPAAGNYAFHTIIHEFGHSLGLSHPHENDLIAGNGRYAAEGGEQGLCPCCAGLVHGGEGAAGSGLAGTLPQGAARLSPADAAAVYGNADAANAVDAMAWSVMSYSSYAGASGPYSNDTFGYAQTPMLRDIAAVQALYGADYTTRAGDTVYTWDAQTGEKFVDGVGQGRPGGGTVFETVWDGGGRDTIDLSRHDGDLRIDLSPGGWIDFGNDQRAGLGGGHEAPGNVALAYLHQGDQRALVENAVGGSGDDVVTGNQGNNVLVGGAGADRIEAVGGNNVLAGGTIGDELQLAGLVRSDWIAVTLPALDADGDDILIGGAGNDIFLPGGGDNSVVGGGGLDTLILDFAYEAIEVLREGLDFIFSYLGGSTSAEEIDFLATRDGIFALTEDAVPSTVDADITEEIVLLYTAGLGREIDPAGLAFWSDLLAGGYSLRDMAADLIDSREFAGRFGEPDTMSDAAFIAVIYENVLGRQADADGAAYWADMLTDGAGRPDLLLGFAVSEENRERAEAAGLVAANDGAAPGDGAPTLLSAAQWAEIWG